MSATTPKKEIELYLNAFSNSVIYCKLDNSSNGKDVKTFHTKIVGENEEEANNINFFETVKMKI